MKINYNEIAELIGRTEANIKYMKKHNPKQLEVLKIGGLCKKYDINETHLLKILNERNEKEKGKL